MKYEEIQKLFSEIDEITEETRIIIYLKNLLLKGLEDLIITIKIFLKTKI